MFLLGKSIVWKRLKKLNVEFHQCGMEEQGWVENEFF